MLFSLTAIKVLYYLCYTISAIQFPQTECRYFYVYFLLKKNVLPIPLRSFKSCISLVNSHFSMDFRILDSVKSTSGKCLYI